MTCTNFDRGWLTPRVGKQLKSSKIHLNWVQPEELFRGKMALFGLLS